jgi:predicted nucleic acid-binding protein
MSDRRFTLDTNILIYALNRQAGAKHTLALDIIARAPFCDCWLTLQSISEFYFASTRKRLIPVELARAQAEDWLALFRTVPASASAVHAALRTGSSGRASYWDALLIHIAAEVGCTAILTEDLEDGTDLAGVRIINPFADLRLSPAAEALLKSE